MEYQKEKEPKIEVSKSPLLEINKKKEIKPKLELQKPIKKKKEIILDDYELNHLNYDNAIEYDKRSFCRIYWSIIKRDELLLFAFVSSKDYNITYIKFARLIFTIATLMTMNAFLFADKSIHYLFINGVRYNFKQQVLQIALSIIITHVFEVLLCFLTLTDRVYYEIKALSKFDKNSQDIFKSLRIMKIKLIIYFVFSSLLMIFYWYFISAFCSVYHNTQVIYIIDCVLSLLFFMVDPLIIYAFVTLLRYIYISLKNIKGNQCKCLYITSRLFPIF